MKWILILLFTTAYRGEAPQLAIEFDTEAACHGAGDLLVKNGAETWGNERIKYLCVPKGGTS